MDAAGPACKAPQAQRALATSCAEACLPRSDRSARSCQASARPLLQQWRPSGPAGQQFMMPVQASRRPALQGALWPHPRRWRPCPPGHHPLCWLHAQSRHALLIAARGQVQGSDDTRRTQRRRTNGDIVADDGGQAGVLRVVLGHMDDDVVQDGSVAAYLDAIDIPCQAHIQVSSQCWPCAAGSVHP